MTPDDPKPVGAFSTTTVLILSLLFGGLMLAHLTADTYAWIGAVLTVIQDATSALAVVIAAGGFGYLVVARLAPTSAATGLRAITACGVGLWMLSTAVLVIGTAVGGLLKPWLWWPVVAIGVILAAWQGRKRMETWSRPRHTDGRGLMWVVLAGCVGLWLAGATVPPGALRTSDSYDVLEYHLQAPREFLLDQRIGELPHNVYSYYPLGAEMLFLLGMVLRGGAYEGVYLAKFLHGMFALLTIAGVYWSLRAQEEGRGRFGALLLGTVPLVIYLTWLGMVELAEVFYLAMALLWLRHWLREPGLRAAACLGLMLGAACAMKYLSVGLVVAPVAGVMLIAGMRSPRRRLMGVLLAGVLTLVPFAPWLVRNTAYTGNPVFPLATSVFGRGHWSGESEARWQAGHAPGEHPPVPEPAGYEPPPPGPSRAERLLWDFLASELLGPMVLALAILAFCAMVADRARPDPWDVSLFAVFVIQVAVWMLFTHQMPTRFIVVGMVPATLLAGGLLARLARVRANPLRRGAKPPAFGPWGLAPAGVITAIAAGIGVWVSHELYRQVAPLPLHGVSGEDVVHRSPLSPLWQPAWELPEGSRLLLVGEAQGFYFPPDTVYATAFDANPLAELVAAGLEPDEVVRRLRDRGITHLWVNWSELARLATTYGYPAELTSDLLIRLRTGGAVGTDAFDRLGLIVERHVFLEEPSTQPTTRPTWPYVTIYRLPITGNPLSLDAEDGGTVRGRTNVAAPPLPFARPHRRG